MVGTVFTPVTLQSIVGQLFNGIDSEALMAIPFFLLVGELMTSANVVIRIAELSQALVGHVRGGLAQVTTVFSMFFSGMSGSSSADVAVLSRTMARPMATEGYSPAFVAALIAAASTIANLVPPSILAVVYGAIGNVSIAGLFLAGIVPGVMVGAGLMLFCYFFGPVGFRRPRSSVANLAKASRAAALPMMIPIILLGGIMTGWFTPTEAGVIAIAYICGWCRRTSSRRG
jgi:tripartite ATP-independent transporter DctM subunit